MGDGMTRFHIWWANACYLARRARTRIWHAVTIPVGVDAETEAWLASLREARDWQPDTIHRPGIYVDAEGRTVVRDRWGTAVVGGEAA